VEFVGKNPNGPDGRLMQKKVWALSGRRVYKGAHPGVYSLELRSELAAESKGRHDMAGYESQQVGDATEISTTPETVPAPWMLVAIPGTVLMPSRVECPPLWPAS
jgi:hypothetical protein